MIEFVWAWIQDLGTNLAENYHWFWDSLDILLVACAVYWLLILIRGTRAQHMTLGLLMLVFAWVLSENLQLATVSFFLDRFLSWGVLIVIVIFQADIRRALTRVGGGLFQGAPRQAAHAVEEVVRACQALGQRRVGALIVIEREISLEDHMDLGTPLDSELSRDLLISLFLPYAPLHDGAVIVRESRIAAAGCILPLTLSNELPSSLGTRHRAAIGISEETDAIAIIVSEETGRISLGVGGELTQDMDGPQLRQALLRLTGHLVERERVPPADDATVLHSGGLSRQRELGHVDLP
ncbi:MAG: diadenylate cyclase CdaA [Myxococcota bacterium]